MKLNYLAVLAALVVGASTSASAALTVYTDRAAFQAALTGGFTTENFNSVVGEPDFTLAPLVVGGLTLQGFGRQQGGRNYIDRNSPDLNVDGTPFATLYVTAREGGTVVNLGFASSVFGFGADFRDLQDDEVRTELTVGSAPFLPSITVGNTVRFIGVISDTAFSNVNFRYIGNSFGDGFGMDNVVFGRVAAVPEPEGLALVLTALACLGWATRRSTAS
jgi:hypothetical protein